MTQLALKLADRDRTVSDADVCALDAALTSNGWMTAAELGALLLWTDRKVRAVANADARFVSYPGSPGYKMLRECTVEEFARAEAATASQVRHMTNRLLRMRAAYHKRAA